jgi:hypothetical protein
MRVPLPAFLLALSLSGPLRGGTLPPLVAKDLAGRPVALDAFLAGTAAVGVAGFTMNSSAACREWGERLWDAFGSNPKARVFSVVEIQGAPSFVVPMIMHSLKSKTDPARYGSVFVAREGRPLWERYVGYDPAAGKDDPYLFILDGAKTMVWKGHGPYSAAGLAALESEWAKVTTTAQVGSH